MNVYAVDPVQDPRWPRFLLRQPRASIFHTPGWLEALRRTFGYEPAALTTSAPGQELSNGIVFCRIRSRLTGRRVSLPFSDHCDPLVDCPGDLDQVLGALANGSDQQEIQYAEIRPRAAGFDRQPGFAQSSEFWFHTLDLSPRVDDLFRRFHRDCIQRKILRAEREGLLVEAGRSESLLRDFYSLMLLTRRRLKVPPHPVSWFENLLEMMNENLEISVARKGGRPVASILTLRYKDALVYKYGCSDASQNRLGGMPLLLWRAIQQAKELGMREVDFGRSDCDDSGLITFKDRWGCTKSRLQYWISPPNRVLNTQREWIMRLGRPAIARVPMRFLPTLGKLVTKHLG